MFRKLKSLNFKYEVDEFGIVRNVKSKRILKQRINQRGYYVIGYNDRVRLHTVPKEVHTLVAEAFLEKQSHHQCVNHLDGNKLNNHISNLKRCTLSENSKHAYDSGFTPKPPSSKPKNINLKNLTRNLTFNTYKDAYRWCKEQFNIKAKYGTFIGEILKTCRGLKQHTYNCKWSFEKPVSTIPQGSKVSIDTTSEKEVHEKCKI